MAIVSGLLNILLVICSVFLICLVLIQRGKGGGLAGAFGGVGGSSAFGTKAGDVFTRVTIVTAVIWFVLSMILVVLYNQGRSSAFELEGEGSPRQRTATGPASKPGEPAGKTTTPAAPGTAAGGGLTPEKPETSPTAPAPKTNPDLPGVFDDTKPATDSSTPAAPATPPPAPAKTP